MSSKENKKENDKVKVEMVKLPVRNIRMLSDEEWNRMAYMNALNRGAISR